MISYPKRTIPWLGLFVLINIVLLVIIFNRCDGAGNYYCMYGGWGIEYNVQAIFYGAAILTYVGSFLINKFGTGNVSRIFRAILVALCFIFVIGPVILNFGAIVSAEKGNAQKIRYIEEQARLDEQNCLEYKKNLPLFLDVEGASIPTPPRNCR